MLLNSIFPMFYALSVLQADICSNPVSYGSVQHDYSSWAAVDKAMQPHGQSSKCCHTGDQQSHPRHYELLGEYS